MNISMPLEGIVTTAIEQISTGVQLKVSQIEEQKSRDFLYQMKELEFYKSNYEKDLKDIFDYWFEIIRLTHIKDNKALTPEQRAKLQKEYDKQMNVATLAKYQMNTLKYAGNETARALALARSPGDFEDDNKAITLFLWTNILSVLKRDILGQKLNVLDILRVLLNDFDEYEDRILAAKEECAQVYHQRYNEWPYWR